MSPSPRRRLAPEVIQSSAMDCGPAALKSLLEGFGIPVSYGRLREACQTSVDGTSIDTLQEVAVQLGLDAEQVMIPVDHVLEPAAEALPALVVVRLPDGLTHFVVAWRDHRGIVQVMDPGTGRRWPGRRRFLEDCFRHAHPVPAAGWREWAGSAEFLAPLRQRLARLGVAPAERDRLVAEALEDPGWRSLAALDATVRMTAALTGSQALRRGHEAAGVVRAFFERARSEEKTAAVPESFWSVLPRDASGEELYLQGAVLVRVRGRRKVGREAPDLPPELAAALSEPPARPARHLLGLLFADGALAPAALGAGLAAAAAVVVAEALLFRSLLSAGRDLGTVLGRLAAFGALGAFLGLALLLRGSLAVGELRLGRKLEIRLRLAFAGKLPRLADRYFASRLRSDMAERSHVLHHLRSFPRLGRELAESTFLLLLTTLGLIWLDPASGWLAGPAAVAMVALPWLTYPLLAERDLRVRSHAGALSRFYLDGLLGLSPIRSHRAETAVRRQHEGLATEWTRASRALLRAAVACQAGQSLAGFALVIALVVHHLSRSHGGLALLFLYWALQLPALGERIALLSWQYPAFRSKTLRVMEALEAPEEPGAGPDAPQPDTRGVELSWEGVCVQATGHEILTGIDLDVPAGSHVAILGASGAGKSSLLGLLLGWHRPAAGRVRVDGEELSPARLQSLRRATVWIDPAVYLWNRPLLANLRYGAGEALPGLGEALSDAELLEMLQGLPEGLQTPLGEGGALVSGGEGQRVRLGRGLLRPDVRLVLLDEPFRGLDRETRHRLLARVRRRFRGVTLLCVTHDVEHTLDFSRVVILDRGRIVEDGEPGRLLSASGSRYRELLAAEEEVRTRLWSSAEWRRLRIEEGRLREEER